MKALTLQDSGPSFPHWLRQRYIQIIIFTSLLMVDVVVTYLTIEVYQASYEQNPFMAPNNHEFNEGQGAGRKAYYQAFAFTWVVNGEVSTFQRRRKNDM